MIGYLAGTKVMTDQGAFAVPRLKVGDRLITRDNGIQDIQWIGRKRLAVKDHSLSQWLQPILVRKGALGPGVPSVDFLVSPDHRLLISGAAAKRIFGEDEVLIAARHLVGLAGIENWMASEFEYVHFHCGGLEMVSINGAWVESLQPSEMPAIEGSGRGHRTELFGTFPELTKAAMSSVANRARRTYCRAEAELVSSI